MPVVEGLTTDYTKQDYSFKRDLGEPISCDSCLLRSVCSWCIKTNNNRWQENQFTMQY